MSPPEQGEAGQDPAGPDLTAPAIDWPTRGTEMETPTCGQQLPKRLEKGKSPTGWRLQTLGKSGLPSKLVAQSSLEKCTGGPGGWGRPGDSPSASWSQEQVQVEGSGLLRAPVQVSSSSHLIPGAGASSLTLPTAAGNFQGTGTSKPRENASKIPWAFSSLVNQVSIYRCGNMRGESTGRKYMKC